MAKTGMALWGLVLCALLPAAAQDVYIGGELELTVLVPSEMDAGTSEARIGLGPNSVLNLEAEVREDLSVYWELNAAKEMSDRAFPLTLPPICPQPREQYFVRAAGLGPVGATLTAGKFFVPVGLRPLHIEDRLMAEIDTGLRVDWAKKDVQYAVSVVDGRPAGQRHPRAYLSAAGKFEKIDATLDVGWGNSRNIFGISGSTALTENLNVGVEYLNGKMDVANAVGGTNADQTVRSLYVDLGYRLSESPYTAVFKFRDVELGPRDISETKWGIHYDLAEDVKVKLEWLKNSVNPFFEDGLLLEVGTTF